MIETSLNVTDYPEPPEDKTKCYQFDFNASIKGYGYVYAETVDEAIEKATNNNYDDIVDTWEMKIEEVTRIEEN